MPEYYFTRVEIRLVTGDTIRGQWISASANYITLKAEDGSSFYIPYSSILFIKQSEASK